MIGSCTTLALIFFLIVDVADSLIAYEPCPLLRSYYAAPTLDKTIAIIQDFAQQFASVFDRLLAQGGSNDFGTITPNTTSFSIVFFSGSKSAESDPILFEYHHTAPSHQYLGSVTSETVYPAGTLTQLFTMYAWLIKTGDGSWESPITDFLPELSRASNRSLAYGIDVATDWESVSVGSLASHMSGILRNCE